METIFVIGHSTMSIERFVRILLAHRVERLVDVRTIPKSRHNPQFNADALRDSLGNSGIDYVHMKDLGGLRRPAKDSVNLGWKNPSFRGYADYMQTRKFEEALEELIELGRDRNVAIVCAEGNPFRCHRSLVADALLTRGIRPVHISSEKPGRLHVLTAFAKVEKNRIRYVEERRP